MASKTELDFIVGALIGTAIGVMAALIFTPLSGKAMRNKIVHELDFSSNGQKGHPTARKRTHLAARAAKVKSNSVKRVKSKNHK